MAETTTLHRLSDSSDSLDALGVSGAVFCCVLWGGNAVAVKASVPDIPAFGCAGLRFVLALPVIALVCRYFGHSLRVRPALWWLLVVHAILSAVQIGAFNWGTSLSEAGRASVLINVHPLVVAPLAWLLLGERMGLRAWCGLGAAALGVLAMLAERWQGGSAILGDLIVLVSGVVFGVQTIAQKKTFPFIPPTTLLFLQSVLAIPLFVVYSGIFEGFDSIGSPPGPSGACFTRDWLSRDCASRLVAAAGSLPGRATGDSCVSDATVRGRTGNMTVVKP